MIVSYSIVIEYHIENITNNLNTLISMHPKNSAQGEYLFRA